MTPRQADGTTRILGPADLPMTVTDPFAVVHGEVRSRGDRTGRESLSVTPSAARSASALRAFNRSLLWHRYLPAHDVLAMNAGLKSKAGLDFSPVMLLADSIGRDQQRVTNSAKEWCRHGVVRWFADAANRVDEEERQLFRQAHERRLRAVAATGTRNVRVRSRWRVLAGLGNASTIENAGLAFHEIYGFPIIPAASLKGVVRHYVLEELAGLDVENCAIDRLVPGSLGDRALGSFSSAGQLVNFVFGQSADSGTEGAIAWFDGWPEVPPTGDAGWFDVDVMTPHHAKYYADDQPAALETDEPNPLHFLTVAAGVWFGVPIGLTDMGRRRIGGQERDALLAVAEHWLTEALDHAGVGAKTGAGYGHFTRP